MQLNDKFAFQPELLFSMKGYTFKNASYSESQALNYIDIPLAFNFGRSQGLHVLVGAQPSFLLSAKYKYQLGTADKIETDNKDLFKGLDVAFLTGFGFQHEGGLDIGFRLSYGLIPVFESSSFRKLHNLNMQISIGYALGN